MVHYDSILVSFACLLVLMTFFELASAFFVFNYVLFPLLKDPLIYLLGNLGLIQSELFPHLNLLILALKIVIITATGPFCAHDGMETQRGPEVGAVFKPGN